MAINDLLRVPGNELELQDNTSLALSDGGFAACATRDLLATDNPNYPLYDLEFEATWVDAVGINLGEVKVYSRKKNVDGTKHSPVPSATYPRDLVCSLIPAAITSLQTLTYQGAYRSLYDEELYVENATGKQFSNGWRVRVTPVTHRPAAA